MRICIPTMGKEGMKEKVHNHFGSAGFFTIYDTKTKKFEIVENKGHDHVHGACQPLKAVEDHDVDVVLSSGMGRRALCNLNDGGIKVYLAEEGNVEQILEKFNKGELDEMRADNACEHHECH